MKKFIWILICSCTLSSAMAQFGINGAYRTISASAWEDNIARINSTVGEPPVPMDAGWAIGFDYWFRLKNKRIEFLPELNLSSFSANWSNSEGETGKIGSQFYSFYFNTNFYVFDLAGDCDCPTFSKDGDLMKKGFFIQVSPGISLVNNKYDNLLDNTQQSDSAIAPSIGIAAGIDFGLSDLLTITPMIGYRQHFGVEWTDLHTYFGNDQSLVEADNTSSISMLHFGLRLGLRLGE